MTDELFIKEMEDYFFEGEPLSTHAKNKVCGLLNEYAERLPKPLPEKIIVYRDKIIYKDAIKVKEDIGVNIEPEEIIEIVSDVTGVSRNQMSSIKRHNELIIARHLAMSFICQLNNGMSYRSVGEYFNGRDHSTVIYAVRNVRTMIEINNPSYTHFFKSIDEKINQLKLKKSA